MCENSVLEQNDFDITPNGGRRLCCNGGFWFTVKINNMPNAEIDK
jgi:hypothetical protein